MTYFLGVDQGSNSSRAVLFDSRGDVVASASQKVSYSRRDNECVEYDADHLLDSVRNVIRQVLARAGARLAGDVSACGIATQRSTALAWRADGKALSPALSWQDVRARSTLERLKHGEQEIMQLTGLPLTPYYSASKLSWLLNNADSVRQCAGDQLRLSPLVSYLLFHVLENAPYSVDFSNAQRTLLFDLETLDWSEQLCDRFGIDASRLPGCAPMVSDYGCLAESGIPVRAVCGDQNAAMFGFGTPGSDAALVNIGSGAFVLRQLARFSGSSRQLTGIAYSDAQGVSYMREATINGAGNALSWAEQEWRTDHLAEKLPGWLTQIKEPPVFINAVGGLGTPWMRGGMPSYFLGDGDHSTADKAVAIIESIVFMIQINLELMAEEAPLQRIRVSGGLSRLDGLCQRLSNLSGLEIERTVIAEATARGVAWLAAGCPKSWSESREEHEGGIMLFIPQHDPALQARFRLFRSGVQQLLDNERAAGARQ